MESCHRLALVDDEVRELSSVVTPACEQPGGKFVKNIEYDSTHFNEAWHYSERDL